jgi:hypothetical protein
MVKKKARARLESRERLVSLVPGSQLLSLSLVEYYYRYVAKLL